MFKDARLLYVNLKDATTKVETLDGEAGRVLRGLAARYEYGRILELTQREDVQNA